MYGSHMASSTMDSKESVMGIYEFGQSATKTRKCSEKIRKNQELLEDKAASMGWSSHKGMFG